MTIATCYTSPEGIVLGADSTSSIFLQGQPPSFHYFNHAQKLFEIGENSTLGLVTWGLASVGDISHRKLVADFADSLVVNPATSVHDAAQKWAGFFWAAYSAWLQSPACAWYASVASKLPFDPSVSPPDPNARTLDEEGLYQNAQAFLFVGFAIGGHVADRTPVACVVEFFPSLTSAPVPRVLQQGALHWWGVPNIINRMVRGYDDALVSAVLASGKWTGSDADLRIALDGQGLVAPAVYPIRDAIDYVYACIHSTIKALKFSTMPQVCGGPIEVAVVTTDRRFRWVKHKAWDAAIHEGAL